MNKKSILVYLAPLAVYWAVLSVLLGLYGYKGSFLVLNRFYLNWLDYPVYGLTWLGDSLFITSLFVLIFPKKLRFILMMILTLIITGLVAQFLKEFIFPDCDRPLKVFEGIASVHFLEHYRLYHHSFPSGHSTSVGAAATVAAWYLVSDKNRVWLIGILSVLVSYTRIYLGVHFAGDVLAGSILGTLLSLFLIYKTDPVLSRWIEKWNPVQTARVRKLLISLAALGCVISIYSM